MIEDRPNDLFHVGKIVGFHGLRGEVKIRPSTNSPDLLVGITSVKIRLPSGQELAGKVGSVRLVRRLLLVNFVEYKDRTEAEFLENADVYVTRDQLEPLEDDEWWVSDLVGLEAYTVAGELIGTVVSIIDSSNQLLEIQPARSGDQRTILVPFVKALVPKVDLRSRRIEVANLPGLLDPQ